MATERILALVAAAWVALGAAVEARGAPGADSYAFSGEFDGLLAGHVLQPRDLASQRLSLYANQSFKRGDWSGSFGFSGWSEAAYASNPGRYPASLARQDSRDLRFRDLYLQYQAGPVAFRLGNQQAVWGEAFGFFYSDIVNPKDLRDGAFGSLSALRLQTPMLNVKWVQGGFSWQGLVIPSPTFNLLPLPGSDFSPLAASGVPVEVNREIRLPISQDNLEFGGRASLLVGSTDLSVFYLDYYDRFPHYSLNPSSTPSRLVVDEAHSRTRSAGLTATSALGDYVLRFEGLVTLGRRLSMLGASLATVQTDQYVYVVGVDLPSIGQAHVGLQWSQDILARDEPYLWRKASENLVSLLVQSPVFFNHQFSALYSLMVMDGGNRLEATYTVPLGSAVQVSAGARLLLGPPASTFGRVQAGSRAFVELKGFFKG